jgi:hypothetical protein
MYLKTIIQRREKKGFFLLIRPGLEYVVQKLLNEKGGVRMAVEVASAIKLEEAYFCLNCEVVTNCVDTCPACGHRQLWCLENWLGKVNACENSMDKEVILQEVHLA